MAERLPSESKALRLTVHGRVQGVGFRYWTHKTALSCGIGGWVRNEPGGTVTVVCEGPAAAVDGFLARVKKGPPGARVDSVDVSSLQYRGAYRGFSVEF